MPLTIFSQRACSVRYGIASIIRIPSISFQMHTQARSFPVVLRRNRCLSLHLAWRAEKAGTLCAPPGGILVKIYYANFHANYFFFFAKINNGIYTRRGYYDDEWSQIFLFSFDCVIKETFFFLPNYYTPDFSKKSYKFLTDYYDRHQVFWERKHLQSDEKKNQRVLSLFSTTSAPSQTRSLFHRKLIFLLNKRRRGKSTVIHTRLFNVFPLIREKKKKSLLQKKQLVPYCRAVIRLVNLSRCISLARWERFKERGASSHTEAKKKKKKANSI